MFPNWELFIGGLLFFLFNVLVAHRNMKWSDRLFLAEKRKADSMWLETIAELKGEGRSARSKTSDGAP